MPLTRRQFLVGATTATAAATTVACTPDWLSNLDEKPPTTTQATPSVVTAPTPYTTGAVTWTPTPPALAAKPSPIMLALNHMTFGARPGDVERVAQMGLENYIEQQLNPNSIDDSALDKILAAYPTLTMSQAELLEKYPRPQPQARPTPAPNGQRPTPPPPAARPKGPQTIVEELQEATLLRAIYSERQLYEMLVDFWSNHFNIYIRKGQIEYMKTVDDREVIRKHALGKFRDMLLASAKSPAMLDYLDNRVSVKGKPNENYAREIMELHTLGVDGGYTYADIQNVARAFTGWTVAGPRQGSGYLFNARQHDDDEKIVLGVKLPKGGGESDGIKVIDILCKHPATATYLATKLVRRFVSDNPPESLVKKVAAAYQQSDGDIKTMMRTLLKSDEFKNSYGQKVRRPLEFLVGVIRALDVKVTDKEADIARMALVPLGQPLFVWPTPDGYPDQMDAWINTNGMLARWNIVLNLVQDGPARGAQIRADVFTPTKQAGAKTAAEVADYWIQRLLGRAMSTADREQIIKYMNDGNKPFDANDNTARIKLAGAVALVLSSPDYQYR
jgi:uncharacterized protein (DUF1800 family)